MQPCNETSNNERSSDEELQISVAYCKRELCLYTHYFQGRTLGARTLGVKLQVVAGATLREKNNL